MLEAQTIHFMSKDAAEKLAATNQADDDECTYEVRHADNGHFVMVVDEDGTDLGTL